MVELHKVALREDRLVLLTMEDIRDKVPLMAANFKDDSALRHKIFKSWIGLSHKNEIRFGVGVPEMINGIWYIKDGHFDVKDIEINVKNLVLDFIE